MRWSYGITTVPSRRYTTLPKTLASLKAGGFEQPHLFVDGGGENYDGLGCITTLREVPLRAFGNWITSLWELYILRPSAHRIVIFQDDVLCYKNLRQYLEKVEMPKRGYLNLITQLDNEVMIRDRPFGFLESGLMDRPSDRQTGLGALGLVFDREALLTLLCAWHILVKPLDPQVGHRKIDGAVVQAMNAAGFREYIHNPTLLTHIGEESTIGNNDPITGKTMFREPWSWRGPEFDALDLLPKSA